MVGITLILRKFAKVEIGAGTSPPPGRIGLRSETFWGVTTKQAKRATQSNLSLAGSSTHALVCLRVEYCHLRRTALYRNIFLYSLVSIYFSLLFWHFVSVTSSHMSCVKQNSQVTVDSAENSIEYKNTTFSRMANSKC